jgi:hypothetical protein
VTGDSTVLVVEIPIVEGETDSERVALSSPEDISLLAVAVAFATSDVALSFELLATVDCSISASAEPVVETSVENDTSVVTDGTAIAASNTAPSIVAVVDSAPDAIAIDELFAPSSTEDVLVFAVSVVIELLAISPISADDERSSVVRSFIAALDNEDDSVVRELDAAVSCIPPDCVNTAPVAVDNESD